MYAIFQTGGKQYRAAPGEVLRVERIPAEPGSTVAIGPVLLVKDGDQLAVGTPHLEGVRVLARVRAHGRHPKIRVIHFKRRKHHMKRMGHRQHYTEIEIAGIERGA
ncbi:MAG: 50S ribosomal protein L21 [Xanthomonadales bacterium]|nr:50S ribosomal protein L21 [Xanthomonadales bacterium]